MKNKTIQISKYEKILHWAVLLSFLGLCATALAAEYFFSKEAIMDSFKQSLPMLNLTIAPMDQFFISRIARRDTWDIHLYFGLVFGISILIWLIISLVRKNKKNICLKLVLFTSGIILLVTGVWMFLRLYFPLTEEMFGLLKKIHYYAYWIFIYTLMVHIITVIYKENKAVNGLLSNMITFKSLLFGLLLSMSLLTQNSYADSDLEKWINDKNYTSGSMYLDGKEGYETLIKEISNCPYDKCKAADVDKDSFGIKKIEIKKPNYQKGIELLLISSNNGNPLASDKLLKFLTKRLNYKSNKPNGYLLKLFTDETKLNYKEYVTIVNRAVLNSAETKKSCFSEYLYGEINELGLLGNDKNISNALIHYKRANRICPDTNLYKMLSEGKVKELSRGKISGLIK